MANHGETLKPLTCLSADKDSTRPDAYDLDMHEALTSVSSEFISARMPAVCRFMDKYVSGLYGSRSIINWITKNKGKHFLDMVTMSDIAYTVAVIENSYAAWDEEYEINNAERHKQQEEAYRRPQKTVKTKFTNRVGKKRQCNMSGWSADGIQFYNKVRDSWRALSLDQSNPTWSMLEEEWVALVVQAGGRRMNTKNQKMTTTMEETIVKIYGINLSC